MMEERLEDKFSKNLYSSYLIKKKKLKAFLQRSFLFFFTRICTFVDGEVVTTKILYYLHSMKSVGNIVCLSLPLLTKVPYYRNVFCSLFVSLGIGWESHPSSMLHGIKQY